MGTKWPGKTLPRKILWAPIVVAVGAAITLAFVAVVLALAHVDIVGG